MYKSLIRSTMKHNVKLHVAQLFKSITCIFTISTVFCYMYDNTNNRFCIVWRYFSGLSMKFPTKSNCMVLYSSMIYKCTCRLPNFIFIKLNYKKRLYTKLKTTIFFFYMYFFCLHVCVGMVNLSYSKMLHIFP